MTQTISKISLWAGRIISALAVLLMIATGLFGLLRPEIAAASSAKYGYPNGALIRICVVEIACPIIYLIPRTSVLGA